MSSHEGQGIDIMDTWKPVNKKVSNPSILQGRLFMLMSTSVRNFIDREQGKEIEGKWIEYCF